MPLIPELVGVLSRNAEAFWCQFTQKTVVAQAFNPRGCYTETSCLENIKEAKEKSMGVALLVTVLGRSPLLPLRSGV